jgi:predicted transcriptional regulator
VGKVKDKTLRKIEDYFARETAIRGVSEIQVTLEDLRKETQLSLVTIYKALDGLIENGKLEVVQQGNRRSPRIYRYLAGTHHSNYTSPSMDLAGLTKVMEDLIHELIVKEQVVEALRAKLAVFEALETQVLYRLRLSDDVEIIVRKKA